MNESGKACAPCREAHQACDKGRPCGRCRHLDRTHLCRDPPTRRRGRPSTRNNTFSSLQHSNVSTLPQRPYSNSFPPPLSSSSCSSSNLVKHSFLASSATSFSSPSPSSSPSASASASSLMPSELTREGETPPPLLAQYCHRCGVEFVYPEAAFCMACGLKRGLFLPYNSINDSPSVGERLPQKRARKQRGTNETTMTTTKPRRDNNGEESEDVGLDWSSLLFDMFGPASSASSSNSDKNSNVIIKLWLPPMAANTRKPAHSSFSSPSSSCSASRMHLSKAHLLECYIDNQLLEPWALIRPFALDSNGGSIIALNSAFLNLSGYSQKELLGRSSRFLIPEELLEDIEQTYDKMMLELGNNMRNCQVISQDTCTIATKDGTWLMCHTTATAYFGVEEGGGPLCFSVQVRSAVPVQKSVTIEQRIRMNTESWRVLPRSLVVLPSDVRFHDGSVFSHAPLTLLSTTAEDFPLPSIDLSSSYFAHHRAASPTLFSTLFPSDCHNSTTTHVDLLTADEVDGGPFPSSCLSGTPHASSSRERYSQDCVSRYEPSSSFVSASYLPCSNSSIN